MTEIEELKNYLQTLSKYGSALAVLGWDEEVNLPPKAHSYRGDVNALLSADLHRKFIDQQFYESVKRLAANAVTLTPDDKVIVERTLEDLEKARKLPTEFVEKSSLLSTKAFSAWVEARAKSDYKIFEPVLTEIIELKKEEAELLGYAHRAYDALLDEYEPGANVEMLDQLLLPLADELGAMLASVKDLPPAELPPTHYDLASQQQLNQEIAARLGYDFGAGRLDISPHPFTTTFHTSDVRITTRYDETDFWVSLGSTIHEAGHGMYDQGLPEKWFGTPLGESVSLGIHESQSRSWENFVGRSQAFTAYLFPVLKKYFPDISYSEQDLYKWLNRVQPNLIRVESDEVSYNLHIVLRYELEKALIAGDITTGDLPAAWNEKMKKYLGLSVPSDALGVLQDVHWSHGSFGYFPTYTLGNLYAAQLFSTYQKAVPNFKDEFRAGDFSSYLNWLRTNIHHQGRRYQPAQLIKKVTGQDLTPDYLLEHLRSKLQS